MSYLSPFDYDLIIVGGGPCALSASLYSARACIKTAYIEKLIPGGKLNKTSQIDNYPGIEAPGPELAQMMYKQVKKNGVVHLEGEVTDVSPLEKGWLINTLEGDSYTSKAVLIATGMRERILDIKNEEGFASYCAICDGNFYKGKEVIVIGGGNSAADESLYLADIVNKVKLVHRREQFRAEKGLVSKLQNHSKVEIITPYYPKEIIIENNRVKGLITIHSETGKEHFIEAQGVFIYIGLIPENECLQNLTNLEKDVFGFLKVDSQMRTNYKGLYAAGDIISEELRQVVTAVSKGAIASIAINNYLKNEFPST